MNLEKVGTCLKKNTKTKAWWIKLGVAIIISNIFFFLLFSGHSDTSTPRNHIPEGWLEANINADLLTPFQYGKKVILINRSKRIKLEGVLQAPANDQLEKVTVLVKENEAQELFQHNNWEVLPYIKEINFAATKREINHEILY